MTIRSYDDTTHAAVPLQPTESQWGGLARSIVMWWCMIRPTGAGLFRHLENSGVEIPQWLRDEVPDVEHVPPKGTVAAIIYKAMLCDAPKQSAAAEVSRLGTQELMDRLIFLAREMAVAELNVSRFNHDRPDDDETAFRRARPHEMERLMREAVTSASHPVTVPAEVIEAAEWMASVGDGDCSGPKTKLIRD